MKLLTPHITEKSYQGAANAQYTFKLAPRVDKSLVKKLVEKEYKVKVVSVHIVNLPAKIRRYRNTLGKTSPVSKAIVRLLPGQKIAEFDIPEENKE